MKRLWFVLTFVLLVFGLFGCRGESPTLPPPPPPPQPRYQINLYPNNAFTGPRGARTSFVITIEGQPRVDISEVMLEPINGRILGVLEDPELTDWIYRSIIVLADVDPSFQLRVRVRGTEKTFSFPVGPNINDCLWRPFSQFPHTVYYEIRDSYNDNHSAEFREGILWAMEFYRRLLDITWIEGNGGPIKFIYNRIKDGISRAGIYCDVCNINLEGPEILLKRFKNVVLHETMHSIGAHHSDPVIAERSLMWGTNYIPGCGGGDHVQQFDYYIILKK
jgi:hypothetical protein